MLLLAELGEVERLLNNYGFPVLLLIMLGYGLRCIWLWVKPHGDALVAKHLELVTSLIAKLELLAGAIPEDKRGHEVTHQKLDAAHDKLDVLVERP